MTGYETVDDFLLDLDPARRRRRLRAEAETAEEPPNPKVVDADQGKATFGAPGYEPEVVTIDDWLLEQRDIARGERHQGF